MLHYPRRIDADGEFCDDPDCRDCDEDWDDDWEGDWDDDWEGDGDRGSDREQILRHPSGLSQGSWDRVDATMMHPAARAETVRVGLVPRVFAEFLSVVIWWVLVVIGFFVAVLLYGSPPVFLLLGLTLVPLVGETVLTAEFGVTPGKFLIGLRVRSGDSKPGWSNAIVRVFVMVAPFLPVYFRGPIGDIAFVVGVLWLVVLMVSIAVDPDKRGLHDRIAGTSVVTRMRLRH